MNLSLHLASIISRALIYDAGIADGEAGKPFNIDRSSGCSEFGGIGGGYRPYVNLVKLVLNTRMGEGPSLTKTSLFINI